MKEKFQKVWSRVKSYKQMIAASAALGLAQNARAGGTGMPWDSPLQTFTNALTSSVAMYIAIGAFFAAGAALVFGEELSGWVRKMLMVVIAVATLVGGSKIMSSLFGISGATL